MESDERQLANKFIYSDREEEHSNKAGGNLYVRAG